MASCEESNEKQAPSKSSLKSLQADLAKSKENYKHQKKIFEQFIIEANYCASKSASITFKKPNYSKTAHLTKTKNDKQR